MKTTSKFVSFVCSLAMATSTLTGVIVANAEETTNDITQGIVLEYDEANSSSTKAVIDIRAVGMTEIASWDARLDLGTDITYTVDYEMPEGTPLTSNQSAILNGICVVNAYGTSNQLVADVGDLLATVTLTFDEPLENDLTVTLAPNSNIKHKTAEGTMQTLRITNDAETTTLPAVTTTVLAQPTTPVTTEPATTEPATTTPVTTAPTESEEPTATPYVISRPTAIPIPTEAPVVTPTPIEQGMIFEYDETNSSSTKAVINVRAVGMLEVASWDARFDLGSDINFTISHVMPEDSPLTSNQSVMLNGVGVVNAYGTSNQAITDDDNLLATVTLTFEEPLKEDITATLGVNSNIKHKTAEGTMQTLRITNDAETTTLPTATVTILANPNAPVESETPTPEFDNDGELNLSDIVTNAPAEYEGGKLIAVVVDVTIDGEPAEYGKDFVVEYNNVQLTADEYYNLINGYTEPDMAKVISGLKFLVNDGVNVYAAPAYQTADQEATGEMIVIPSLGGEATYEEETPTDEPAEGMSRLTVSEPTHGSIRINYEDADGNSVTDNTNDGRIVVDIPDGTEVEFIAIADSGYTFSGWSGDLSGTANPATLTMTRDRSVMASFTLAGSNNGGGGSTSSGGSSMNAGSATGGIARPNGGTAASVGTTINFQDLGSVPWAETAINFLAQAGIINGRSSTVFDPNASVTRAEFAKMVCATFGIQPNTTAAQTFTDVSPSDWFYGYVQAASAAGIVNGVSDTAFDPNATIKRQEMAAMLYRAIDATGRLATLPAGTAKTFSDYDQIDDYAKGYVTTLSSAGIINGTSETTFEPYATATRAQAAAILYQYLDAVGLTS